MEVVVVQVRLTLLHSTSKTDTLCKSMIFTANTGKKQLNTLSNKVIYETRRYEVMNLI